MFTGKFVIISEPMTGHPFTQEESEKNDINIHLGKDIQIYFEKAWTALASGQQLSPRLQFHALVTELRRRQLQTHQMSRSLSAGGID